MKVNRESAAAINSSVICNETQTKRKTKRTTKKRPATVDGLPPMKRRKISRITHIIDSSNDNADDIDADEIILAYCCLPCFI